MRSVWIIAALLIAGCAHERLAASPPPGVDLSGHWRLNAAESDDPQRLVGLLAGFGDAAAPDAPSGDGPGGADRRGGDEDGAGPRGGGREAGANAAAAPISIGALAVAMQWPGTDLVIRQVGGVAAFSSGGTSRVYQPETATRAQQRAARGRGRRAAQSCGWSDGALLVSATPDDDGPPLQLRYALSANRRRLVETIRRSGGAGRAIELIRVWDRLP